MYIIVLLIPFSILAFIAWRLLRFNKKLEKAKQFVQQHVIDSKERDISEYLKYLFLEKKQNIEKTRKVIIIANLKDEESLLRLYARMLYPSYFFDMYERIINQYDKEEKIIDIVKRIDEYECYLREIYNEINKIYGIKKIDWI